MTDDTLQEALVRPSKSFSIIWLLPLIALVIGIWLLYKSLAEAPIEITIDFPTGTGIEVGKTQVMYEGLHVGVVKDIRIDQSDLKGVIVTVEMDNRTESFLREGTQFWLVKPEISLSGVTGLETLVSGNYIAVKVSKSGSSTRYFRALEEPPSLDMTEPGLHLKLTARDLGSIHRGAPILYRKVVVGKVVEYELDTEQDRIVVSALIQPQFATLITRNTRFWNTSGVRVKAGLDGVDVRMDSLLSVVQGGVTFDVSEGDPVQNGDEFKLYRDYTEAKRGVRATIAFSADHELPAKGARILFKGFDAGEVRSLKMADDHKTVNARVSMAPEMEDYLTTGTRFWLVKPKISLQGVSNLETLVKGTYVEMDIGKGESTRNFVALREPPAIDVRRPGLRLQLETAELGSISVGSPVLYRKMQVGEVEQTTLSTRKDKVLLDIRIEPEYQSLVHKGSRFWNASGVSFSGSLSKVSFRTESLTSILQGGVGFFNPPGGSIQPVRKGSVFRLYEDYDSATEKGTRIEIILSNADGVAAGTPIRYQGIDVGVVKRVTLKPDLSGIVATAQLLEQPERFATAGAVYWLVQPKLSITGAANLETLVTGKYFEVVPGSGPTQNTFVAQYQEPARAQPPQGLNLRLVAPRLGSIRKDLSVYYRDVVVGKVTGYRLADSADQVEIFINVEPAYVPLLRDGTRFWNTSGISVDVGLFKGAQIKAESLESILAGGIAFSTPDNGADLPAAKAGETFRLYDDAKPEWLLWKPRISLKR